MQPLHRCTRGDTGLKNQGSKTQPRSKTQASETLGNLGNYAPRSETTTKIINSHQDQKLPPRSETGFSADQKLPPRSETPTKIRNSHPSQKLPPTVSPQKLSSSPKDTTSLRNPEAGPRALGPGPWARAHPRSSSPPGITFQ